jgi:hypothetical protein
MNSAMTNIYAIKMRIDGQVAEIILNALNPGEAIRKAEQWFARKFDQPAVTCSCKLLTSIVIYGHEQEIVSHPAPASFRPFVMPRRALA